MIAHLVWKINGGRNCFQHLALNAIQLAAEMTLTTLFKCEVKMMVHGKHLTLRVKDMHLVMKVADALGSEYFNQTALGKQFIACK
ncbi:hypothetical protein FQN50_009992 [Emmonsiellopsis sp. PD_5]|nr:hypothetical protein FQN50_009992 [Emmonsiellopsis sp. PD_5]